MPSPEGRLGTARPQPVLLQQRVGQHQRDRGQRDLGRLALGAVRRTWRPCPGCSATRRRQPCRGEGPVWRGRRGSSCAPPLAGLARQGANPTKLDAVLPSTHPSSGMSATRPVATTRRRRGSTSARRSGATVRIAAPDAPLLVDVLDGENAGPMIADGERTPPVNSWAGGAKRRVMWPWPSQQCTRWRSCPPRERHRWCRARDLVNLACSRATLRLMCSEPARLYAQDLPPMISDAAL